jgi:sugar phosphate permease
MLSRLLIAWSLMALCVMVHAMGMTAALRWVSQWTARMNARFWFSTWMLVRTAGWIILLHLVEIAFWAFFYAWKEGMPDLQSALYFSAVTYTTTGYGDLVLPP